MGVRIRLYSIVWKKCLDLLPQGPNNTGSHSEESVAFLAQAFLTLVFHNSKYSPAIHNRSDVLHRLGGNPTAHLSWQ